MNLPGMAQWQDEPEAATAPLRGVLVLVGGVWNLDTSAGTTADAVAVVVGGMVSADTVAGPGISIVRTGGRVLAYG